MLAKVLLVMAYSIPTAFLILLTEVATKVLAPQNQQLLILSKSQDVQQLRLKCVQRTC